MHNLSILLFIHQLGQPVVDLDTSASSGDFLPTQAGLADTSSPSVTTDQLRFMPASPSFSIERHLSYDGDHTPSKAFRLGHVGYGTTPPEVLLRYYAASTATEDEHCV